MAFPPDLIERVRDATDIAAVVGEHVQLKRAGRLFKALCPFHREKTPSFVVNPARQIFKCFGCGQGGDVFRFLMEFEKLSFPEAVEHLAGRAGIPVPRRGWEGATEESVYPALAWAAEFYRTLLAGPEGAPARRYLEARSLGPEVTARFGLGWAPPGWSTLLDAAGRRFTPSLLERAGLVTRREGGGGFYDRFRGRLMIPIRSVLGKTIAFGARTLGDEEPKYLNSPETEAFVKGRVLFGLAEARDALKTEGTGIVVEGYMDVMGLVQAGFLNAAASCGTAFTPEQARALKRYVERAVLLFDGDAAGVRAAWRSAGVFLGEGLDVRVVALPDGHDPDSFVRERGRDAMAAAIAAAPGVVGFARDVLLGRLERRDQLVRAFAVLGSLVEDPIRRRLLLQEAAEAFRFEEQVLADEAARLRQGGRPVERGPVRRPRAEARDVVGREYVAHLLTDPQVRDEDLVPEDVIQETRLRALYRRWLELRGVGEERPGAVVRAEAEHASFAAEIEAVEGAGEEAVPEVLDRLRARAREARGKTLREAIRDAETRGDDGEVNRLLKELQSLRTAGR